MKRLCTALSIVMLAAAAAGQTLQIRTISRTVDVTFTHSQDGITFYSGETVQYDVFARLGTNVYSLPTNVTPIWAVTDATLTNFYVYTNATLINATAGHVRATLSSAAAALPVSADYQSAILLTQPADGTNVIVGVGDRTDLVVKWRPFYNGSIVQPLHWTNGVLDETTVVQSYFWGLHSNAIYTAIAGLISASAEVDPVYTAQTGRYYAAANPSNYISAAALVPYASSNQTAAMIAAATSGIVVAESDPVYLSQTGRYYSATNGVAASNLAASLVSPLANVSGRVVEVEGWGNHASAGYWQDGMTPDKYITAPNGGRLVFSSVSNGPAGITWTDDGGNELLTVYGLGGAGLVGGSTNTYESYVTYLHTGSSLNGANILAYSISSNAIDAATDAAYRSGGTGRDTNAAYAINVNGRTYTPTGASQVVSLDSAVATNWNTLWTKGANLAGPSTPAPVNNGGYVCMNAITFEDSAGWACYWDIPPGPTTVQVRSYWMTSTNQAAGVSVKLGWYSNNVPGSLAYIYQQYALTSGVQFLVVTNIIPVNPLAPNIGLLRDGAGSDTSTNKLYLCGVDWRDTASPNWINVGQGGNWVSSATNALNMNTNAITGVTSISYATAWPSIYAWSTNASSVATGGGAATHTNWVIDPYSVTFGEFNPTTGIYTVKANGQYDFKYMSSWDTITANATYTVGLNVDGTNLMTWSYYGVAQTYLPLQLGMMLNLVSGQTVKIVATQVSGSTRNLGENNASKRVSAQFFNRVK